MVMRSIPELLNDSSSQISIAVPRNIKEGSSLPSSSSDSDEDIDELPFIPMPLNMEFSGSRKSLNDIQSNEEERRKQNGTSTWPRPPIPTQEAMECDAKAVDKEGIEFAGKGQQNRSLQDNNGGSSDEEAPAELPQRSELSRNPLRRGSSMESDKPESGRRRELRRGGSADSALLLCIEPREESAERNQEDDKRVLKKAVSMELPRRSTSPGTAKMSQEDYALKLELMRQRLLRSGSADNKMSGLRGPLLETLGMGDEKRAIPSDRYSRTTRLCPPPLIRAASSDSARDEVPKPKILRKSASFSQGDSEPIVLHRRSGAPLEIPLAQVDERKLKEAISMSALTEQTKLDSRPVTPREPSPKLPTPECVLQESQTKTECKEYLMEEDIKLDDTIHKKIDGLTKDSNFDERSSTSGFSEKDISEEPITESEYMDQRMSTPLPVVQGYNLEEKMEEDKKGKKLQEEKKLTMTEETVRNVSESTQETLESTVGTTEEKVQVPAKASDMIITTSTVMMRSTEEYYHPQANAVSTYVTLPLPTQVILPDGRTSAYASVMQTIMVSSVKSDLGPSTPIVVPDNVSSSISPETVVPTYSTASISSALPGPPKPSVMSTREHPAVYSRVASPEMIIREPSPPKATPHSSSQQELSTGTDFEDITSEEVFEARFKKHESSLSRSLKFLSWSKNEDRSPTSSDSTQSSEEIYRPSPVGSPLQLAQRRLEEKSKSVQDLREAQKDQGFMRRLSMRLKRTPSTERKDKTTKEEESVASRRRLSWTLGRRGSQDKKEVDMMCMDLSSDPSGERDEKEPNKRNESPVLSMRRKIESTVAGISTRIRSYSEERRASEEKDQKRTPILSILRRSTSESRATKVGCVPQNQLATQTSNGTSTESLDSMSSLKSETCKGIEQSYHLTGNLFPSLKDYIIIYAFLFHPLKL